MGCVDIAHRELRFAPAEAEAPSNRFDSWQGNYTLASHYGGLASHVWAHMAYSTL